MDQCVVEEKVRSKIEKLSKTELSQKDINTIIAGCQRAVSPEVLDYALEQIPGISVKNPHITALSELDISGIGIASSIAAIAQVEGMDKAELIVDNLHKLVKLSRTRNCTDTGMSKAIKAIDQAVSCEVAQATIDSIPKIMTIYEYGQKICGLGEDYPYKAFMLLAGARSVNAVKESVLHMEEEYSKGIKGQALIDSVSQFMRTRGKNIEIIDVVPVHKPEPVVAVPRKQLEEARAVLC